MTAIAMNTFFSIDHILFTIGGQGVSYLEFLAVIFGLTSVFLCTMAKSINYWVGFVYTALLFLMFMQKHLYANTLLQPISLSVSIYGLYCWTHPRQGQADKKEQLKISFLSNKQRMGYVLLLVVIVVIWGTFLTKLPSLSSAFPQPESPYLDASVAAMMLTAQLLAARKKWENWLVWFVLNTCNIILYIRAGLTFMPIVAFCYNILSVIGIIHWRKEWKKQQTTC